ncbi:MAG: signal peptidase I [Deltaproteobacteria bacterium]|nr:signal peptidase I [Deltaproteobacteria bacterium]
MKLAKRMGETYQPTRANRMWAYAAFVIGTTLVSPQWPFRVYVIESFHVPNGSMRPTVEIGDRVFVTKLGPKNKQPERGDLVAFRPPFAREKVYLKRLVGMPGDEVAVRDGVVFVNGVPIEQRDMGIETFWDHDPSWDRWESVREHVFGETIGDRSIAIVRSTTPGEAAADMEPHLVPPNGYFVLGDNRDNSVDSRRFGPVPAEDVIGKADSVWWSFGEDGIRWNRIGLKL